jgi:predicted GH43/DUF377 family glycosyl hydrolase
MEPDPADPREVEGVLNPAVARTPEGHLYLLPRLVAARYYSRIGLARVLFNRMGEPAGVERLGVALEPEAPYELNPWHGGCVEDPRVTYLPGRHLYVMTYTAVGPAGPRIALAVSRNVLTWHRLGLARFAPYDGMDLGQVDNKDGVLFPDPVPAPDGRLSLALLHRPTSERLSTLGTPTSLPEVLRRRPSMWISYAPLEDLLASKHLIWGQHRVLLEPRAGWERLRVGAGTPPLRTSDGWLVLYHGVCGHLVDGITHQQHVRYSMGVLLLDEREPWRVLYRSARAILAPRSVGERAGSVPHVVFPTGLDLRPDGTVYIYYGMADTRIGVARTHLAHLVPSSDERAQ